MTSNSSLHSSLDHPVSRRQMLAGATAMGAGIALGSIASAAHASESASADADGETAANGGWSWEQVPDPIDESLIVDTVESDIVIVGCGLCGSVASYSASKNGASVQVIEKMEEPTGRSVSIGVVNSQLMSDHGIFIDRNAIVNDFCRAELNNVSRKLVEDWADNSARICDELVEISKAAGYEPETGPDNTPYVVNVDGYREYNTRLLLAPQIIMLVNAIVEKSQEQGAVFNFSTTAEQLEKDGDRVVAVIAKNADGDYVRYRADKGVIMASGDFAGNEELMEAHGGEITKFADPCIYYPEGGNTGEGIKMMLWAGAAWEKSQPSPMIHCIYGAPLAPNPWLRVNVNGERYENEDVPEWQAAFGRFRQPDNKAWAIFDSDYTKKSALQTPGTLRRIGFDDDDAMSLAEENGYQWKADTIEELAEQIGVPSDTLVATVDRYNELCSKGVDDDYGKSANNMQDITKPPFYAAKIYAPLLVMIGGVDVNDDLQVLDTNGDPIPGLYAAGDCSGNFFSGPYPLTIVAGGHGRSTVQGYMVGEALANA